MVQVRTAMYLLVLQNRFCLDSVISMCATCMGCNSGVPPVSTFRPGTIPRGWKRNIHNPPLVPGRSLPGTIPRDWKRNPFHLWSGTIPLNWKSIPGAKKQSRGADGGGGGGRENIDEYSGVPILVIGGQCGTRGGIGNFPRCVVGPSR